MADTDETGESLRAKGNGLFEAGKVNEAIETYRASLAKEPSAKTLGNLSLALLTQGSAQEALEAAEQSLAADKTCIKAYDRKANAELACGKPWKARRTLREALEAFARDKSATRYYGQRYDEVCTECKAKDTSGKVETAEHFAEICRYMPRDQASHVSAVRLATMATFWNESAAEDRLKVFVRFLQLLTGAQNPTAGTNVSAEMLSSLPMENYKGVTIPAPWVTFFAGLDAPTKVVVFQAMYEGCSDPEKTLIAHDLRELFPVSTSPSGPTSS
ncbi:Hypothetical Protein FCC1311_048702 [Hondaea fermentalgiana]|uniref:Uncharacterized protein n=1 Tax=Hondaea fermentalgiana TaxID=2315210 RepID=A0A2R5GE95_9STRA|nr:Hypothetical Protein FCC1311_048702 [Hondaea fermentalgiana]|eukprot:GBG28649.1 Hypothetical Protein FCC1311_048702 [Hondaea fermentalgiana]